MRRLRTGSARAGFSLVETVISASLLTVVSMAALVTSSTGVGAFESARMNTSAQTRVQRAMSRVVRELMSAGWDMVGPADLDGNEGSDTMTFQQAEGYVGGAIVWGDLQTLQLELEEGELDDGADNDGDGVADERQLVLIRDVGGPNETRVVLCRSVREMYEGEEDDNDDTNGNGVVDEAGFNVHQEGDLLVVRLCVEEASDQAGTLIRSMETSVRLRN